LLFQKKYTESHLERIFKGDKQIGGEGARY
jgi:hypothetical protein